MQVCVCVRVCVCVCVPSYVLITKLTMTLGSWCVESVGCGCWVGGVHCRRWSLMTVVLLHRSTPTQITADSMHAVASPQPCTHHTTDVHAQDNLKYSKTKLPRFSCLLQHSARKRGGLILHRPPSPQSPQMDRAKICQLLAFSGY